MPFVPRQPLVLLTALLLGAISFAIFSWHNDFPSFYHSDEPSKVSQVRNGVRKFNHPLLLVTSTEMVARVRGDMTSEQAIVESGRLVSATAAAISVALLFFLATMLWGFWPGLLAAGILATLPLLVELSHYLKEDCCLLLGVTAFYLALVRFEHTPTLAGAAWLGAACGLATSGKFIGASTFVGAVLVMFMLKGKSISRKLIFLGVLLAASAVTFTVINFQGVFAPATLQQGLYFEYDNMKRHTVDGGFLRGLQSDVLTRIPDVASWPLLALAALGLGAMFLRGQSSRRAIGSIIAFLVVYLLLIQFSPWSKARYLLPFVLFVCLMAGGGAKFLAEWVTSRWPRIPAGPLIAACAAVLLIPQMISSARVVKEFSLDQRVDLIEWAQTGLPADAVVAADIRSRFRELGATGPIKPALVFPDRDAINDPAFIDQIRATGITHVIVVEDTYRYARKRTEKKADWKPGFDIIFPEKGLLWQSPSGENDYTQPGLRVYAVRR